MPVWAFGDNSLPPLFPTVADPEWRVFFPSAPYTEGGFKITDVLMIWPPATGEQCARVHSATASSCEVILTSTYSCLFEGLSFHFFLSWGLVFGIPISVANFEAALYSSNIAPVQCMAPHLSE